MSGVVTAAVVVGGASVYSANKAAGAAGDAADTAAGAQQNALNYQQEMEEKPARYRDLALGQLGGFYGLDYSGGTLQQDYDDAKNEYDDAVNSLESRGYSRSSRRRKDFRKEMMPGILRAEHEMNQAKSALDAGPRDGGQGGQMGGQQAFVDQVQQSPFYQSMISQGEDAVARGASFTGGVRSGSTNEALAQNSQNVLQGLTNQRLGGLQGFANQPLNTNAIAGTMGGIGNTLAQGQIASAQAQQAGTQGAINAIGGGIGSYLGNRPTTQTNPYQQQQQQPPVNFGDMSFQGSYPQGYKTYI